MHHVRKYLPLLRPIALLALISGMAIALLAMGLGAFRHDEAAEQENLRKALQELEQSRKK